MTTEPNILACVDRSRMADHVADAAAWAARCLSAPLELLHVLDHHPERGSGNDHSGTIGVDAQAHLLDQLANEDQARTRAAREEGRLFLNRLRERALASGATPVDMRQRHGSLADTLAERASGARLLVLGRRGEGSQAATPATTPTATAHPPALGQHVAHVVRSVATPTLTVAAAFQPPSRVLLAHDGSATARHAMAWLTSHPLLAGLPIHLLLSGKGSASAQAQLTSDCATLQAAGFSATSSQVAGDAPKAVAQAVKAQGFDLLVMGAHSHAHWRSLLVGSTTTDLLRATTIPTLLLR